MKTFKEILEAEVKKQEFVVTELQAELDRMTKSGSSRREVVELMNGIAQERRVLIPLKKVLEAYRREQEKKE